MAVRGVTFSMQNVSSNDDSHVYKVLLAGRKGRTKGCEMTYNVDDIYISKGYFFSHNRLIEVSSLETVATPVVNSGTLYCRLVFEIDMTKTNTKTTFNQGYFKVLSSETDYPKARQDDLEDGGTVYQLPFARFTKTINGIGSFSDELETIQIGQGGSDIYVSTTGNDTSGDGSENYPYRTIQHAVNMLPKDLRNEEITLHVKSGTYSENVVISGFYGGTLRLAVETVSIKTLTVYETVMIIEGTSLTLAANGLNMGLHCHRGATVICQCNLIINGSVNGLYVAYGSRFTGKNVELNSCTNGVVSTIAAQVYVAALTGSRNNNGVTASGGIVSLGSIGDIASVLYATSVGGRIYTGSQANVPVN